MNPSDLSNHDSFSQIKFQYASVFVANIIAYSHGFGVGWLSSAIPTLRSDSTPLKSGPLTLEQISWLGGSFPLGALFGDLLFSLLLNFMGRKTSLMVMALPNLIFWFAALLSTSYTELVIGRFIGGLSGGGILVVMPLFIAEIANKKIRGFLGTMGPLSIAIGTLVAYICGALFQFQFLPYCIIGFPVVFLIVMLIIPETPHSLIRQKRIQESLIHKHNDKSGYNVQEELAKLQLLVSQRDEEKRPHSYSLILQKDSLKKVSIGMLLVALSMCSGILVVTMYAAQLFIDSGAKFNPYVSAIIVGVLQVCGICVSSVLVDKVGRRVLFGISSFGAAISLIMFGTFSFLHGKGVDLSSVDWLPVVSLSFYIFINCVGLRTVPFLYIAESLPYDIFWFAALLSTSYTEIRGFLGTMGPLSIAIGTLVAYICVQKDSLKKVSIGMLLVALSMCSGILVVTMYAAQLFIDSGAKFNPYVSAIVVGVLQVCGICVSSVLVDKVGRRVLFGISSFGAAISLIMFGTFSFLHGKGVDLSSFDWLPVVSLSFYIFINCVGLRTVPFLYIAEILPYNIRQIGLTICMIVKSSFGFLVVFTKPFLQDLLDLHVVIWMYACVCILATFFSIFLMVETKGKNLN
ncbi:Facilitated trehalose transporter Tret1, partial [Pseudolycoriella hygida]